MLSDRWVNSRTAPGLRGVLLLISLVLGLSALYGSRVYPPLGNADYGLVGLLLTALPLALIAVLASLRPSGSALRQVMPLAEALAVGSVVGFAHLEGAPGQLFASLFIVAVFMAGQRLGLQGALFATALGIAPWLAAAIASGPDTTMTGLAQLTAERQRVDDIRSILYLLGGLLGTSVISAWIRRLLTDGRSNDDASAYTDAFRLLSELQHVARNLSLGLDPVTLATALTDDLRNTVPDSRASLAIRGPEGRFAPLVGHLDDDDHAAASAAWLSNEVSRQFASGEHRIALPVLMGDRVISVAVISGTELGPQQQVTVAESVRVAGPRLAAALLFDEVRQLATVDERLRLAREIHDGIAQELASLGYLLDDLAERVPAEAAGEVRVLREHVRKVTSELRLSIFDLRAGVDDEVTLGAALAEHVQRLAAASRLVAHTMINEQGDRLPTGTEIELLRIAQEALTNVRKHARADNVWIDCVIDAPDVLLRIADDGVGLQPPRPGSMGLKGMRERASRIGGTLSVGTRDGGGTEVEVRFGDPVLAGRG